MARSRHFIVHSDLDELDLMDVTQEFEQSYRALKSCVYPGGDDPPGVSHVVLLEHWSEYEAIRPEGSAAYYSTQRSPFETTPKIVLPARKRDRMLEVFQHELVHRFVRHYFPAAPRWLHEGLAQVMSTAAIEDQGVVVGREIARMHWDGARWTVYGMSLPDLGPDLTELVAMNSAIFKQEAVHAYPGSWAFVHTLMLGEPEYGSAFGGYLGELRSGVLDERQAFARHFAPPLLARIEKSYRERMATENLPMQVYPLTGALETEVETRPVGLAEAFSLWGRLRMDTPEGRIQAIQDAERAIASEPSSPEGYVLRATLRMRVGGVSDALKDIRHALKLRPDEQRLLRALTTLLLVKREASAELDALAIRLRAHAATADDFNVLARYELFKGRPAVALELATRAAHEDEGCGACLETAALAAFEIGDVERAVRLQGTALSVVSEFDVEMPRMETTLAKYRQTLAQGSRPK